MTLSKLWTEFSAKLHTMTAQAAGAVYVDGVRDMQVNNALQTRTEGHDGVPYNTFGSLISGRPTARFSTSDIAQLLDEVSVSAGMLIDADGTHPGVVLYAQRMAQGGTRDAVGAGTHISVTVENGMLVPQSLTATHQDMATLTAQLFARQSGAVDPLTYDLAADLDAVTPDSTDQWTIGPVDLNGTPLDGIQSLNVDFGFDVVAEGRDSDIFPTFVSIRKVQPSITIQSHHVDLMTTLTNQGLFQTAGQVRIFLRKRAEGGTFIADATPVHILLTLDKARVEPEQIGQDPKSIGIRITPWHTQPAGFPIAINTAVAIT